MGTTSSASAASLKISQMQASGCRLVELLKAAEPERWRYHDPHWLQRVAEEVAEEHFSKHQSILSSQREAYEEVRTAPDGIFFSCCAEETSSDYRRSMLQHQAREEERKRCSDSIGDPRFAKRVDLADGASKTFEELRQKLSSMGMTSTDIETYWNTQCRKLFPNDRPPQDLVEELSAAGKSIQGLLRFLQKRTPHLAINDPKLAITEQQQQYGKYESHLARGRQAELSSSRAIPGDLPTDRTPPRSAKAVTSCRTASSYAAQLLIPPAGKFRGWELPTEWERVD